MQAPVPSDEPLGVEARNDHPVNMYVEDAAEPVHAPTTLYAYYYHNIICTHPFNASISTTPSIIILA
jgi:hypothetical protein